MTGISHAPDAAEELSAVTPCLEANRRVTPHPTPTPSDPWPRSPPSPMQMTPRLKALFAPYAALLTQMLGEGLSWSSSHHTLPPLSAIERERALNRTRGRRAAHAARERRRRADGAVA